MPKAKKAEPVHTYDARKKSITTNVENRGSAEIRSYWNNYGHAKEPANIKLHWFGEPEKQKGGRAYNTTVRKELRRGRIK
jgi:hypothetical protein